MKFSGTIKKIEGVYSALCDEVPVVGVGDTPADSVISLLGCLKDYVRYNTEWGHTVNAPESESDTFELNLSFEVSDDNS